MGIKSGKIMGLDWYLTKRLLVYVRRHSLLLFSGLFFLILADILSVLHPYLFKLGVDEAIMKNNQSLLIKYTLILGMTFLLAFVSNYLFNYLVQYLGQKLLFALRFDLYQKTLSLPSSYFDRNPSGRILTNITNDVESIREFIADGIVSILGDLLKLVFILSAMLFIDHRLALISFATIPLFVLATSVFRRSIRSGFRQVRKSNAEINSEFVESINGIKEIRLFMYTEMAKKRFTARNKKYLQAYMKIVKSYALYFPTIETVSNVSMVLIMIYSHFYLGHRLQVGVIFSFFTYLNMFFRPLRELAENFNMFQTAMAAAERIFKLMDEPISITSPTDPIPIKGRLRGKVEFRNVHFSYDGEKWILQNIDFTIQAGEKVALVGKTGSGKSTIIKLLSRLYDVQQGNILLDGVDIRRFDLTDLRRQIAVIPQEPMIFSGNVIENIRLYDPAVSEEEVIRAAKAVHVDEFIRKLENGYQTDLKEGGKILSVGQKQLISLARAFVKNPSIIILDEATANIDSETEKLLEEGLKELLNGRTGIVIAHRLSTIQSVDRIIVIHNGSIVEMGTHQELVELGGHYAKLYETQKLLLEL